MSSELKKLKSCLVGLQELQKIENPNLTDFQKQTIENFVNFAEFYELITPIVNEDTNITPVFTPDLGLKQLISKISPSFVLNMFNDKVKSNFSLDKKINFGFTEYFDVTGDPDKMFIRGDISAIVDDSDEGTILSEVMADGSITGETNNVVLIELQVANTSAIPERVHAYGNNKLKKVNRKIKKLVDNETILVDENVYLRPYELVIYTSTKFKKKEGFLRFNTSSTKYESNGVEQSIEKGDVITHLVPFVNIFQMTLEELNNSSLSFFQCIYLYKFKQDKSLIKDKAIIETAKAIEQNLKKQPFNKDYDLLMKQFNNILNDLCKELNSNPQKYKEEIEIMNTITMSYSDLIEMRAYQKGMKEAEEKANLKAKEAEEKANQKIKKAKEAEEKANLKAKEAEEKANLKAKEAEEKANLKAKEAEEKANLKAKEAEEAEEKAYLKTVNSVKNMIKLNMSDEIILQCIELSLEEITEIRNGNLN